jgi:RNA polymerase sigma-70 factor (ECF subfamily)
MNEQELVRKARSGDFEAFSQLVAKYQTRIYNLALKMTGNEQDGEDIVQDTLVKAIDNIDRFRGESSFGTWLYSIALNEARTLLSKRKQTDLKPIEEYLPSQDSSDLHSDAAVGLFDWKDPHHQLENQELRQIINAGITELPYIYRAAFLLRYIDGLSIKEIAELTGETVAATKSRVLRARLALRDNLSKAFEGHYG